MTLFRLKPTFSPSYFLATCYVGEVVERDRTTIKMKNVCTVYEALTQNPKVPGGMDINMTYHPSQVTAEGIWTFLAEAVLGERELTENDIIRKGYDSAMEGYRTEKAGLVRPGIQSVVPPQAPLGNA